MRKNKLLLLLALLLTAATGARAAWTGGTYTATATENLGAITVNGDATLTINSDVTVTVTGGINVASGTLTVTGPGTLVVNGAKGNNGASGLKGSNGSNGGVAISGNIIVQGGATVTATGGNGGKGGNGDLEGGNGGNGGVAFAGTLTYKSGTVTANGGSAGSGGWGEDMERYASSGSAGKAFANDVDFTQTTGYSVTNGTSTIGSVLNQTKVVISGGSEPAAATTYTVSLKDNVKDADKWTITPTEATTTGVAENTEVTLKYNGRLKVKGVTATVEAPAEATPALSITSPSVGQVIGSDGKNYDYGSLPTGVTAVAKICYVSGSNGLALALTDEEGTMEWRPAIETIAAHTAPFTGGTWKVASKDEWSNMITAAGSYSALRDGFSSVGGTNMQSGYYWTSTEWDSNGAWSYNFSDGYWASDPMDFESYVRACLAFTVEQAAKPAATVTTAPTGAAVVGVGKTTALVSGGVADGGTLWYAVTTTNTKPASTDGFSDAVPTAKDITASGKVYVWYYVKGDDTHTDSEIAATAIEVPVADVVWDATNVSDLSVSGNSEPYEKEGVTLSCNANQISAAWHNYGDPTKDGISFNTKETGGFTFTAPTGKAFAKIEMKANGPGGWSNANLGTGWAFNNTTVTWTGSASTVDLLTGANKFNKGTYISYIAFYLSE